MTAKDRKAALEDWLRTAILTLELRPGADLDEAQICARFDLSRTPVREVFRALDGLGYVDLRENRGARVAELSHTTMRDFFLAAPMIYGAILRLAARNAGAGRLAALKDAQAAFREALRTGSAADRSLANNRFHEITGEMAGTHLVAMLSGQSVSPWVEVREGAPVAVLSRKGEVLDPLVPERGRDVDDVDPVPGAELQHRRRCRRRAERGAGDALLGGEQGERRDRNR